MFTPELSNFTERGVPCQYLEIANVCRCYGFQESNKGPLNRCAPMSWYAACRKVFNQ
jgi:hypothetical protein